MKQRFLLIMLAAAALLAGALALRRVASAWPPLAKAGPPTPQAPVPASPEVASPRRVGFVDLETVYNSCKQSKAVAAEITKFREEGARQLKPMRDEIERLEERLKDLADAAPERAKLAAEVSAKQREYLIASEPWSMDLNKRLLQARVRIYMLIRDAVARVAKARGLELVIADIEEPSADLNGTSAREFDNALDSYTGKIHRKTVLFAAKEVNLTAEVLEAVNAAE